MKQAWSLRSRLFCLLDFVGQNPMLVIIGVPKAIRRKLGIADGDTVRVRITLR